MSTDATSLPLTGGVTILACVYRVAAAHRPVPGAPLVRNGLRRRFRSDAYGPTLALRLVDPAGAPTLSRGLTSQTIEAPASGSLPRLNPQSGGPTGAANG